MENSKAETIIHMYVRVRSLVFCIFIGTVAALVLYVVTPRYDPGFIIPVSPKNDQLLIEAGKELSSTISMFVTLITGLFVATALATRQFFRPSSKPSFAQTLVLAGFLVFSLISIFYALHAHYAIAEAFLSRRLDFYIVGRLVGVQGLLTGLAAVCVIALIADILLSFDRGPNRS